MLPLLVNNPEVNENADDLTLGLKATLLAMGMLKAPVFVDNLYNCLVNKNLFSFLYLAVYYANPGLGTVSALLTYLLDLIEYESLEATVQRLSPRFTSYGGTLFPILSVTTVSNYQNVLDLFGYPPIRLEEIVSDPFSYLDWVDEAHPNLVPLTAYLREGDIPEYLAEVLLINTGVNVRLYRSKWIQINYFAFTAFSPFVIGHDYNQIYR